jgi:hypothetical protein
VDENYCCEVHLQKLKRSDGRADDTSASFKEDVMEKEEIEECLVRSEYMIAELQSEYFGVLNSLERIHSESKGVKRWIDRALKNMRRRTREEIINESRAAMGKYFESDERKEAYRMAREIDPEFKKKLERIECQQGKSLNLDQLERYLADVKDAFGLPCDPESES